MLLINDLTDFYEDIVLFINPDYKNAIIGVFNDINGPRAVYDYDRMIDCLVQEGFTYDESIDFIEYNTIRSLPYIDNGPIVMERLYDDD